jgi:heterogeneous nuclear ribonucleoprotein F/H
MQGCEPVDILLVKRDGRFSGEAFVVLGSPLQIQMAVDKNKSYMGRRYVEVFRAKKLVRQLSNAAAATAAAIQLGAAACSMNWDSSTSNSKAAAEGASTISMQLQLFSGGNVHPSNLGAFGRQWAIALQDCA